MPASDVDVDPIVVDPLPSSSDDRFVVRWLRGIVDDLAAKLDRRTRKIRGVLSEHDSRLDVVEASGVRLDVLEADGANLLLEQNRAERVAVIPASAARGSLLLVQGDDGFLYVGLGNAKPLARVALKEVV